VNEGRKFLHLEIISNPKIDRKLISLIRQESVIISLVGCDNILTSLWDHSIQQIMFLFVK